MKGTPEEKLRANELAEQFTTKEVAKILGRDESTIMKWVRTERRPYRKASSEEKERAAQLYNEGLLSGQIGEILGRNQQTVYRWLRELRGCPIATLADGTLFGTMFCGSCPSNLPQDCPGTCSPKKGSFCKLGCSCKDPSDEVIEAGHAWFVKHGGVL